MTPLQNASTTAPVSVIIPTYNSARWLGQAIDSALAQSLPPARIIVIDDGSTDDTAILMQRYAGQVQYVRQANGGVSAARNQGLQLAQEPYVAFLDADDVWHPEKLKRQMGVFHVLPDLLLLGTRAFDWPTASLPHIGGWERFTPVTWEDLVVKNRLVTSSVIVRRDAIERAGIFDKELQGPEDRDMWLRIVRQGDAGNIELPLTGYREVAGSVSKQAHRCYTSMRRIIAKLEESGELRARPMLRRKALSQVENTVACIYSGAGEYRRALGMMLKSVALYPFPYDRAEVDAWMERPRRVAVYLLRWLRLKPRPVNRLNSLQDQSGRALYV